MTVIVVTQTNAFRHRGYFIKKPRPLRGRAHMPVTQTGGEGMEHVSRRLLIGICHDISGKVNNMPIRAYVLQSNEIGFLSVNLSGSRHVFIT